MSRSSARQGTGNRQHRPSVRIRSYPPMAREAGRRARCPSDVRDRTVRRSGLLAGERRDGILEQRKHRADAQPALTFPPAIYLSSGWALFGTFVFVTRCRQDVATLNSLAEPGHPARLQRSRAQSRYRRAVGRSAPVLPRSRLRPRPRGRATPLGRARRARAPVSCADRRNPRARNASGRRSKPRSRQADPGYLVVESLRSECI